MKLLLLLASVIDVLSLRLHQGLYAGRGRALLECGDEELWARHGAAPPKENDQVGEYTLKTCLGAGAYGEVWSTSKEAVLKIGRSTHEGPMIKECIFGQAIFARDPVHFTDCLEVGEWKSGTGSRHIFAAFTLAPGKPWTNFMKKSQSTRQPPLPNLVDAISLWVQFGKAIRAMFQTSPSDVFKLIDSDVITDNLMVNYTADGAFLTIIDYGLTQICCDSSNPSDCQKFLRPNSGPPVSFPFPPCAGRTEEEAKGIRSSFLAVTIEFAKVCAETIMAPHLLPTWKGTPETIASVVWPSYATELRLASVETQNLFQDIIDIFFSMTTEPSGEVPQGLYDKLSSLHAGLLE